MKRLAALFLALMLTVSLCACGDAGQEAQDTPGEGLFHEITGLDPEATMLTVDGRDVSVGMYLYWLVYTMNSLSANTDWVDEAGLLKWDAEVTEGQTVKDLVVEETLNTAKLYMIVENWAEMYDMELSDEEEASLQSNLESIRTQLGGQEAYEAYMWDMGLTPELNERLSRVYYLYAKMQSATTQEASPLYITDDILYQYDGITEDTILADHILLTTGDDEAENQQLYATMEQVLQALRDAGENAPAVFTYLADNMSQDPGRSYYPNGYLLTQDSDYVQAFKDAAFALEENEFSDIITTDYGYHIIMRRPIREYVAEQYLSELLTVAIDNADVTTTDTYSALDVEQFQIDYQTYTALHSAVQDYVDAQTEGDGADVTA